MDVVHWLWIAFTRGKLIIEVCRSHVTSKTNCSWRLQYWERNTDTCLVFVVCHWLLWQQAISNLCNWNNIDLIAYSGFILRKSHLIINNELFVAFNAVKSLIINSNTTVDIVYHFVQYPYWPWGYRQATWWYS